MNFAGKYSYSVPTPEGREKTVLSVRQGQRGYEGEVILSKDSCVLMENVCARDSVFSFDFRTEGGVQTVELTEDGGGNFTGKMKRVQGGEESVQKLEDVSFSPKRMRALILYATMTKNTEKIAVAMKETFEYYRWEVTLFRMTMKKEDWAGRQEDLYFDDYDVVCLGSPIVAGYPITVVNKVFSLGAGGQLEQNVQKQVDGGAGFKMNSDTMKGPASGMDEKKPGAGGPPPRTIGAQWRRRQCAYPGGPTADNYQPVGVVFTTYGGGFYGSNECRTTLAALKMFLEMNNVSVIGQFACCGREFGPAGLKEHEKPRLVVPGEIQDPAEYETADGKTITGSYFYHARPWDHPLDRDIQKARFLISDIVEDVFLTYNGKRAQVCSEYISIS